MDLTKEAYEALEDIVGPEYISQDPAIRDTYNQVWGNKLVFEQSFPTDRPPIVLPGSTEEVQAIVRACNRYKISFKPFSSGFEIVSTALVSENSIILDLKRMNRILEIDTRNMHAVVEPYVSRIPAPDGTGETRPFYRGHIRRARKPVSLPLPAAISGPEIPRCLPAASAVMSLGVNGFSLPGKSFEWVRPKPDRDGFLPTDRASA